MKKQRFRTLFFATLFGAVFMPALRAQDVDQEMAAFAKQFQETYNKEDHATLKTYYTDDAVRIALDGSTINGAAAIGAFWEAQFKGADLTLVLTQELVSWSDFNHAYVAKGSYRATGTSASGEPIDISGHYSNIMLKQNGVWKISKSSLLE
jgi:ketosteroid isomerase-like protein